MMKLILELNKIDYDEYLQEILQKAAEHPELTGGIKLPKGTSAVLKHLPRKAKNEMIAKAINSHSQAAIGRAEQMLQGVLGPVRIRSFLIECGTLSKESVVMNIEIQHFDGAVFVDTMLPKYYSEDTAERIFAGFTPPSYRLEDAQSFIKMQNDKDKQLLIGRSISSNKEYIIEHIERKAKAQGIDLDIHNLRVLVK